MYKHPIITLYWSNQFISSHKNNKAYPDTYIYTKIYITWILHRMMNYATSCTIHKIEVYNIYVTQL